MNRPKDRDQFHRYTRQAGAMFEEILAHDMPDDMRRTLIEARTKFLLGVISAADHDEGDQ